MTTVDGDIIKFNDYVLLNRFELTSRNKKMNKFLTNLFKGYGVNPGRNIRAYVAR